MLYVFEYAIILFAASFNGIDRRLMPDLHH